MRLTMTFALVLAILVSLSTVASACPWRCWWKHHRASQTATSADGTNGDFELPGQDKNGGEDNKKDKNKDDNGADLPPNPGTAESGGANRISAALASLRRSVNQTNVLLGLPVLSPPADVDSKPEADFTLDDAPPPRPMQPDATIRRPMVDHPVEADMPPQLEKASDLTPRQESGDAIASRNLESRIEALTRSNEELRVEFRELSASIRALAETLRDK